MFLFSHNLIDSDGSTRGEYLHYIDQGATYREIHISSDAFNTFEMFISMLSHEAIHASVSDFLTLLESMGKITKESHDLITERIAYTCQEIVKEILLNEKDFRKEFNKVKIKDDKTK